MASTNNSNLALALGFKGSGTPNALPSYTDEGALTLGGYQASADTQTAYFGYLASRNPSGADSAYFMGIPSNYIYSGVLIYSAGIAMIDPAKPNSYLANQPLAVMHQGAFILYSWDLTANGSIAPVLGARVVANNTTGQLGFLPLGATAPSGYTIIPEITVKSVNSITNSVLLFINR